MKQVLLHLLHLIQLRLLPLTDAEEVNVTEETSETEADAFSDGDDGTAVPSQEQTDDAFTAGTDTAAALPDETPSTADATDAVGAAVVKAEDWVSTENGFKLRKPAKKSGYSKYR